jgi:hypothetical protein
MYTCKVHRKLCLPSNAHKTHTVGYQQQFDNWISKIGEDDSTFFFGTGSARPKNRNSHRIINKHFGKSVILIIDLDLL